MVTTPSSSAQSHYDSDRKKRHTMEKSKVINLTRQLQLRLQYAKLKVDHGWQRQNLNEVENLYFHHSHIRGPRQQPIQLAIPAASPARNSYLELELGNAPSPQPNVAESQDGSDDAVEMDPTTTSPAHERSNNKSTGPQHTIQQDDPPVQIEPSMPSASGSSASNPLLSPAHRSGLHVTSNNYSALIQLLGNSIEKSAPARPTPNPPPPPQERPPISTQTRSNVSYGTTSSPSTNVNLFSSTSNMALTYDAFWSNHNSSRPFRSPFLNLLSSADLETNKAAAQALLSGLSGKNIGS